MGHLPALLAIAAGGHRAGAGRRSGPGHQGRGLLRRGHHHAGGRGRATGPGRGRRVAGSRRICSSPRRRPATWTRPTPPPCTPPSAWPAAARPTTSAARPGRRSVPSRWPSGAPPTAPRWPWPRTCAAAWPAEPKSVIPAMARRRFSAPPRAPWPSWSAGAPRATSSSTVGGSPGSRTPTCGRSASARRCTSPWPARPLPTR